MDPVYGFQAINVEAQQRVSTSLLQWTRRMLHVRKRHPVFGLGDYEPLYPDNRRVFAYVRSLDGDVVVAVANLSRYAQPVELDLARWAGMVPEEMFGRVPFPPINGRPYRLALGPHGFYWFHLMHPSEPVTVPGEAGAIRDTPAHASGAVGRDPFEGVDSSSEALG
jgi:maltose alpha-D-glucosyltransferase / alpha-amylase